MLTERGLDWVLNGVGAIALIVGGLLVLWAMFADRSRGRKRCPKCWYDLTASPGMRCSECGFVARTERKLRKTRRRWRRGLLGLFIVAGGLAGPGYRKYHDDWHRLVPTTALILWMPDLEKKQPKLYGSLESRMADDRLWNWQWEWLLDRCLDEDNLPVHVSIKTRERWPEGVDIHYKVTRGPGITRIRWLDDATTKCEITPRGKDIHDDPIPEAIFNLTPRGLSSLPVQTTFGTLPAEFASPDCLQFEIELTVRYFYANRSRQVILGQQAGAPLIPGSTIPPVWTTVIPSPAATPSSSKNGPELTRTIPLDVPIIIGGTLHDVIKPVRDETIDESLIRSASLNSVARRRTTGTSGVYVGVPRSIARRQPGLAMAVEIELILDGETIKADRMFLQPGVLHLVLFPEGVDQLDLDNLRRLMVRIRGDGELALQDLDATSYWAGDITFPVQKAAPGRLSE